MYLYISLGLNVLFFCLLLGAVFLLNRAGRQINTYEQFYQQTLDDLEKHLKYVQGLMRNSAILSDDDDVKKIFSSIKSFYQLMLGYFNAGDGTDREEKQKLLR